MKILVKAVVPSRVQETVSCTSDEAFLVYGVTNGGGDYVINVSSTGSGFGVRSPAFTVGGIANDTITVIVQPGTTAFLTLQTENGALASIQ